MLLNRILAWEPVKLGPEQIVYIDTESGAVGLEMNHIDKILSLKPDEIITIESKVFIDKSAKEYRNLQLRTFSFLGKIESPDEARTIQIEEHNIRTAKKI